jgi:hypothetical protein
MKPPSWGPKPVWRTAPAIAGTGRRSSGRSMPRRPECGSGTLERLRRGTSCLAAHGLPEAEIKWRGGAQIFQLGRGLIKLQP